jgi:hypothetical protein
LLSDSINAIAVMKVLIGGGVREGRIFKYDPEVFPEEAGYGFGLFLMEIAVSLRKCR